MNLICWAYTWMLVNESAFKGFLYEHPHINSATVCSACGPGSIPGYGRVLGGIFP